MNCKTYFSYRYGTFATEELVKAGVQAGAKALALTNINGTPDTWDFVKFCIAAGIKPIAGVEIRNGSHSLYILLAANNAGFKWINDFISQYLQAKENFPENIASGHFFNNTADGFVVFPLGRKAPTDLLPNELIGVKPAEVNKLFTMPVVQYPEKFIVRQPVTFQNKANYNLHKLLRAIDKNVVGSLLPPEEAVAKDEHFISQAEIIKAFNQYPSILTNTFKVIDACNITMDFGKDKNKSFFSTSKEADRILLEMLTRDGLAMRYGNNNKKADERLTKELKIINDLSFNAYFLITEDIIRYARNKGFYHVGRGSGANSIADYCLRRQHSLMLRANHFQIVYSH